jgi:hypothetical protein
VLAYGRRRSSLDVSQGCVGALLGAQIGAKRTAPYTARRMLAVYARALFTVGMLRQLHAFADVRFFNAILRFVVGFAQRGLFADSVAAAEVRA